jgi:glucokinase
MTEAWAFGVDVGGTYLRVGLFSLSGGRRPALAGSTKRAWRSGDHDAAGALSAALRDELAALSSRHGLEPAATPLGVGLAGQLSPDGRTVVNAPNIGWRDLGLVELLEAELGRPPGSIRMVNDLTAIVRGELADGGARGARDLVAMYVGTGVGGAVVTDGRIVRGAGGTAGEIGHVKLPGCDALCGCGERGCLEAVAGGAALARRVAAMRFGTDQDAEPAADLARAERAVEAGDPAAEALWHEASEALAHVASGMCTFLNPSVLLVGGGVFDRAPRLRLRFEARTRDLTLAVARTRLEIRHGELGDDAGLLGAAMFAVEHHS